MYKLTQHTLSYIRLKYKIFFYYYYYNIDYKIIIYKGGLKPFRDEGVGSHVVDATEVLVLHYHIAVDARETGVPRMGQSCTVCGHRAGHDHGTGSSRLLSVVCGPAAIMHVTPVPLSITITVGPHNSAQPRSPGPHHRGSRPARPG